MIKDVRNTDGRAKASVLAPLVMLWVTLWMIVAPDGAIDAQTHEGKQSPCCLATCDADAERAAQPRQTSAERPKAPRQPDASASAEPAQPAEAPGPAPDGMVWIPGGTFQMGHDHAYPEEAPAHEVSVDGFWMARHPVTNRQFARFIEQTGYVTVAERQPDPEELPHVSEHLLKPGSLVFVQPDRADVQGNLGQWWQWTPGASWRHPEGPGSDIDQRMDHPVVHVAYEDAKAYAQWAGAQLPTEAQWERAARGGLEAKQYTWGDRFKPEGEHMANTWQGAFPVHNTQADGYLRTSPVGNFPSNGYGLYDMAGNVWEWTSNWYNLTYYRTAAGKHNPQGPPQSESHDPHEPHLAKRVIRGGSFLCAPHHCQRYRPSARQASTPDTGTSHIGFRVIVTP